MSEALILESVKVNPQYELNNFSSYCGLTDARMRASEKDLPVQKNLLTDQWLPFFLSIFLKLDSALCKQSSFNQTSEVEGGNRIRKLLREIAYNIG